MIGQSIINVESGGQTRLSALAPGVFLLLMVLVLDKWLVQIPMAALFFANKVGHFMLVTSDHDEESDTRTYRVVGQVFFNTSDRNQNNN